MNATKRTVQAATTPAAQAAAQATHAAKTAHTILRTMGLNDNQARIAEMLSSPVFVEAGAGSGKTFTLTQRIVWALTKGSLDANHAYISDLSQTLIITFTHAAARSIKEKTREALRRAGMHAQALQVDEAWISTIHGMCFRLIKLYALELGIDPNSTIASSANSEYLLHQAFNDVMRSIMDSNHREQAICDLLAMYPLKDKRTADIGAQSVDNTVTLYELIYGIITKLRMQPGGISAEPMIFEHIDGAHEMPMPSLDYLIEMLTQLNEINPKRTPTQVANADACARQLENCMRAKCEWRDMCRSDYMKVCALLSGITHGLGSKSVPKEMKACMAAIQTYTQTWTNTLLLRQMSPVTRACITIARQVNSRYAAYKRNACLLDNDDVIIEALRLLSTYPAVAQELSRRFKLVMVDEFQDTDAAQLSLISRLSNNGEHLATVGDAQQSIYKFRGADVSVFIGRGKQVDQTYHVKLDENFRSHEAILAFVEAIFAPTRGGGAGDSTGTAATGTAAGITAGAGAARPIMKSFMPLHVTEDRHDAMDDAALRGFPRIDVEVLHKTGNASYKGCTAAMVASRIKEYADSGHAYSDVALLMRAMTSASVYVDAMRSLGIPVVVSGGSGFVTTTEVGIVAALLRVLANPAQDDRGLRTLLLSDMFGLDDNDMINLASMQCERAYDAARATSNVAATSNADEPVTFISKRPAFRGLECMNESDSFIFGHAYSKRVQRAHDILIGARHALAAYTPSEVCLRVIEQSGWLERLCERGSEGQAIIANILAAIRYIDELCTTMGLGIARASREFDLWRASARISPFTLASDKSDFVRVMTIHSSKGLEFPVVVLADWAPGRKHTPSLLFEKQDNTSTNTENSTNAPAQAQSQSQPPLPRVLVMPKKRADMPGACEYDVSTPCDADTPSGNVQRLVHMEHERDAEEAARLLYVGLTRARECLVLCLSDHESKDKDGDIPLEEQVYTALFGSSRFEPGDYTCTFAARYAQCSREDVAAGIKPKSAKTYDMRVRVCACSKNKETKQIAVAAGEAYETLNATFFDDDAAICAASALFVPCVQPSCAGDAAKPAAVQDDGTAAEQCTQQVTCPARQRFALYTYPDAQPLHMSFGRAQEGVYSYSYMQHYDATHLASAPTDAFADSAADNATNKPAGKPGDMAAATPAAAPKPTPAAPAAPSAPTPKPARARVGDATPATNFGSAFHQLAQLMIEENAYPSELRFAAVCRRWSIPSKSAARLREALQRWYTSSIRKEALSYPSCAAELDFIYHYKTVYGDVIEGAFDLLAYDDAAHKALLIDYKTGDADLSYDEVYARHKRQAHVYYNVLRARGFTTITCAFVCVERETNDGQPLVVYYQFS